jgi:hypothetical protein
MPDLDKESKDKNIGSNTEPDYPDVFFLLKNSTLNLMPL